MRVLRFVLAHLIFKGSWRFWLNFTLGLICLGLRGSMVFCIEKHCVLVAALLSRKLSVCHPYGLV
jgi:hypothetical protein